MIILPLVVFVVVLIGVHEAVSRLIDEPVTSAEVTITLTVVVLAVIGLARRLYQSRPPSPEEAARNAWLNRAVLPGTPEAAGTDDSWQVLRGDAPHHDDPHQQAAGSHEPG